MDADTCGIPADTPGWRGVRVVRQRTPAGEYDVAPQPDNLVGIHVGPAVWVHQQRVGHSVRRRFLPGDVLVVPAGESNFCAHRQPTDDLYLAVPPQLIATTADSLELPTGTPPELRPRYGEPDPVIDHLARTLAAELTEPGLGERLYLDALVDQLLVHLLRLHSAEADRPRDIPAEGPAQSMLRKVLEHIHDDLAGTHRIDQLAVLAGLSPHQFTRWFKQLTGAPPHRYVLAARVKAARRLITTTSLPLAEIADRVGFYDQSHLNRHLRRLLGTTAAQLRAGGNVPVP